MEIASTLINVFVVVAMGAFLTYMTRERHRDLKDDIARLEARMDSGFNALRSEFRSEFNSVHSDLTALALAVGADAPRSRSQSGNS